ncbi:magnesium chelatase subunit D family protein [Thermodesulforhabdus norvegica]|uniref:Magnesium chelatase subunit D n=1 Tax=Thermodesulforhabdus norvegica TaxID=39841 RepID=A0A1I4TGE1_9BACT|nr:magnesium chelatase subunit D family protein [Thermodesulforhabdus norvegica]SFM75610.1 magnesium chelatase subunit D [Thermodesulforhabdus norvegica]
MEKIRYPFSALVGQELMKTALLLNVIDPSIGGVLIKGERGTAKSTGVRALIDLLPEIRVVKNCPFQCDPDDTDSLCPLCRDRVRNGETLAVVQRPIRLVNLPIGTTEDRLLGTIDIEEAIKKGKKAFEPGLLAEAHRGILYVDEVNLLNDQIVDLLLDVAASGVNIVEREGISFTHASRFVLVGTMNPEEGDLRPQLLDRFGLCVSVKAAASVEERLEIIKRRIAFETDPEGFRKQWAAEDTRLREVIRRARENLNRIIIPDEMYELAARLAMAMETDGHRAEITIVKAARAHAALKEKSEVGKEDIHMAARLSLPHRVKKNPLERKEFDEEKLVQLIDQHETHQDRTSGEWKPLYQNKPPHTKDKVSAASPLSCVTHLCPGSHIPVIPQIPWYRIQPGSHPGRRFPFPSRHKSGICSGLRLPGPQDRDFDLSLSGTLRAAAPYQLKRGMNGKVVIKSQDLRFNRRRRKTGLTLMLVIDSSASMRTNNRMSRTKGIIEALIRDMYLHRDKLGIITFRHTDAEVLLPLTHNMHDAISRVEELPVGGRTPLAKGLSLALKHLNQEMQKNPEAVPVIMVFSDGRPNVSCYGSDPLEETLALAREIRRKGIQAVYVDTELDPMAMGYGYIISQRMNATYIPMDRLLKENSGL